MLGVVKSTILYILNKKGNTGELRNTNKPRRPREKNCDERHEEKPLHSNQHDPLQDVGVSVLKSTIKSTSPEEM